MNNANGERLISRNAATKAGRILARSSEKETSPEYKEAAHIANLWRNQHIVPTQRCFELILQETAKIDGAVSTYRLKRYKSILRKLRRDNNHFRLGELDDIGGCRIIVQSIEQVNQVQSSLVSTVSLKNSGGIKDYIQKPQASGYRSSHLFVKVQGESPGECTYHIEIQIRTQLQHYWATAVEAIGEIYGKEYKSPEVRANTDTLDDHSRLRFLKITSSLFALREGATPIPEFDMSEQELIQILKEINGVDQLIEDLENSVDDVFLIDSHFSKKDRLFLMKLSKAEQLLDIESFEVGQLDTALERYSYWEHEVESPLDTGVLFPHYDNVVLTYAQTPQQLRIAYPNYAANMNGFLEIVKQYLD